MMSLVHVKMYEKSYASHPTSDTYFHVEHNITSVSLSPFHDPFAILRIIHGYVELIKETDHLSKK